MFSNLKGGSLSGLKRTPQNPVASAFLLRIVVSHYELQMRIGGSPQNEQPKLRHVRSLSQVMVETLQFLGRLGTGSLTAVRSGVKEALCSRNAGAPSFVGLAFFMIIVHWLSLCGCWTHVSPREMS